MKIEDNKVVELCYELEVDGEIVDRTTREKPLDYIHGTRSLLDKFEANIAGLEPGSRFEFTLAPAEGYGEIDPDRIIELPKEAFAVNGVVQENLLVPGTTIPMLNGKGGVVPGKVLEVHENSVTMDLNSPMAGKTLNFSGEILTVRDATEKELKEGLHGEYVHTCCCGGHEGGCHGHGEGHENGGCGGGHCHGGHHEDGGCCGHGDGHGEGHCHEGGCHGEGHGHDHGEGCCGKCD
ncbi:MAG: peptidylprolyl isomerase [Bacteroidetes bacterium]|uniref:Peptidyl-prolyl cis-trans isomerase n=1 Tax=Candidatus Cryptobacteroides merdavium TaxID=2840769 RepID=A0A9D9EJ05_9BACT|nr:peptidylprolyl isomerase [Candidatus Cryptobacteroides merdavium]